MARSVTVSMPTARAIATGVVVIVGAVVVLLLGVRVGSDLLSPSPPMDVASGSSLQELVTTDGGVYLGRLVSDDDGYLQLADPAVVRQEAAQQGSTSGPRTVVQMLRTDPYAVDGAILVPREQVTLFAAVLPGSALHDAYQNAIDGGSAAPTPTP